jgi:hypothetical protein
MLGRHLRNLLLNLSNEKQFRLMIQSLDQWLGSVKMKALVQIYHSARHGLPPRLDPSPD